jgi:hypothetical protein
MAPRASNRAIKGGTRAVASGPAPLTNYATGRRYGFDRRTPAHLRNLRVDRSRSSRCDVRGQDSSWSCAENASAPHPSSPQGKNPGANLVARPTERWTLRARSGDRYMFSAGIVCPRERMDRETIAAAKQSRGWARKPGSRPRPVDVRNLGIAGNGQGRCVGHDAGVQPRNHFVSAICARNSCVPATGSSIKDETSRACLRASGIYSRQRARNRIRMQQVGCGSRAQSQRHPLLRCPNRKRRAYQTRRAASSVGPNALVGSGPTRRNTRLSISGATRLDQISRSHASAKGCDQSAPCSQIRDSGCRR